MGFTLSYYHDGYRAGLHGYEMERDYLQEMPEAYRAGYRTGRGDRRFIKALEFTGLVAIVLFLVWVGVNNV